MSLDGFINDHDGVEALYPDLAIWRETEPGKESIRNTGAVVMGRNSFTMADLLGGRTHMSSFASSNKRMEMTCEKHNSEY
jgi:hypothetical protein